MDNTRTTPPPKRPKTQSQPEAPLLSTPARPGTSAGRHTSEEGGSRNQTIASSPIVTTPLTMVDHHRVTQHLKKLGHNDLMTLGGALGLDYPRLTRMKDLLGDMVAAWLSGNDYVSKVSGPPSWASLVAALRNIGMTGIATAIQDQPTILHCGFTQILSPALSRYNTYLKSYYSNHPIASDDKLSIAPCTQFISLALIEQSSGSVQDAFSKSTFHGGVDQILRAKTPLNMSDLLVPGSQFVLVEGPPGIGKSTLCWELCRKWDALKSLQYFKIVLLLKLREKRVQNASELNEIFFHRDKKLCQSVLDEVFECEGEGVLLILDGFDEMPTFVVEDKNSLIMELIAGSCLPKAVRLITSRPSALYHNVFPRVYKHVEVLGFTDECKRKFADITFQSEPDVQIHFRYFIFSNPIINSLMYIPVNCAIIAQVYKDIMKDGKLMPKTMTQLYTTLVLVLIRRHMIEKGEWKTHTKIPQTLQQLPEEVATGFKEVSELAYNGLIEQKLSFSDEDVGEGFQHLGLLSETKEMYVCEGAKSSYSFPHLSIQEFLAAWYLANFAESVPDCFLHYQSAILAKFVAGFAGCTKFPFPELASSRHEKNFIIHCLFEEQDYCQSLTYLYCSTRFNPSSSLDMYTFGYVLSHASVNWDLALSGYSDMLQLVNSCKESALIRGSIVGLDIHCAVDQVLDLESLPSALLKSVKTLLVQNCGNSPLPTKWMSLFHNLEQLYLPIPCKLTDSFNYPQLKALQCTTNLSQINLSMSSFTQAFSELVTNCYNLKYFCLYYSNTWSDDFKLYKVVEAAVSCSKLSKLTTFIPFSISRSSVSHQLESITFSYKIGWRGHTMLCFRCIAELCKIPSMKSLEVVFHFAEDGAKFTELPKFNTFVAALNHSLFCNPSLTTLTLPFSYKYLPNLFKLLHTHPSLLSWNRSKSLNDLSELFTPVNKKYTVVDMPYWHISKSKSCPDLLEMQSLHTMHPLLHEALETSEIYYKNAL